MAGALGSFFTFSSVNGWYTQIIKPVWTPPNWLFGPVWVTLYFLMGVALYLVWLEAGKGRDVKKAVWFFYAQLFLNAIWTPIFFGLHNIFLGLVDIVLLLIFVVWTMIEFRKINKMTFYLFIPYLLWLCLATSLNAGILFLN